MIFTNNLLSYLIPILVNLYFLGIFVSFTQVYRILKHLVLLEIVKGESYYTYRPLLENITRGNTYTIQQTLKVSNGYENILPNDLHSFEIFYEYFQSTVDYSGISMYDMKVNAGDTALNLKLLSKRKRV